MPTERRRTREQSWSRSDAWARARALVGAGRQIDDEDPAVRYGSESANRYVGRHWDEVEPELRRRWDQYEHRGESRWEDVKNSVREAYQRASETEATRD